jgi:pimeloyl-ACP methyl ester carboxylesterase
MRFIKYGLLTLLGLFVTIQLVLWGSTLAALDHDRLHTAATEALPLFSGESDSGLVRIEANNFEFRARVAGFNQPQHTGNLILLHGFPETSIMYTPLIAAADAAGYRVVAFDQRGYSPGARPTGSDNYTGDRLVGDVLAVADAAGFDEFHLVGHDWGAAVGWQVVFAAADRINSWTALSIPHVVAFGDALENDPEQRSKSSYMAFFWLPFIPENTFGFNDFGLLDIFFGEHPKLEVQEYKAVLSEPGAMTGALNWYRAGQGEADSGGSVDILTPTLFIWGNEDPAVAKAAVEGQRPFMKGPFRVTELTTGHWLMATATDPVVADVLAHITEHSR